MENYDTEYKSEQEIDQLIQEEMAYRQKHGDTIPPNENLCGYCRNIDKKNPFCWNCDSGSIYIPITFPLYNIILMFSSLTSGLEDLENDEKLDKTNIIIQKGFIEALKFVVQPYGSLKETLKSFYEESTTNNGYTTPGEIENATRRIVIIQQTKETKIEYEHREKVGAIRTHINACNHCKYKNRLNTKFCWACDRGTNFKNGIRSIDTIYKMLMFIDTISGENIKNLQHDDENALIRIGIAEGLKWVIKPYTSEEKLVEKKGLEYITKEDIEFAIKIEDQKYEELDNYDK